MSATEASPLERAAIVLSALLNDDETFIVGGASPVPLAAALLAQKFHAPNLVLLTGSGAVNPRPTEIPRSGGSGNLLHSAEAIIDIDDIYDLTESGAIDAICLGGLQVDRFGNFNLTAVGSYEAPRLRGPGMANIGLTMTATRLLLFSPVHSAKTLVERVDYATGYGSRLPSGERVPHRTGGGPEFLLTPDAYFEFTGPDGEAELVAISEETTIAAVTERTGWEVADAAPDRFPPVDDEQLQFVRSIDAAGILA